MLKNKSIQKYISLLLVSVYAFVVLFSAKFHHHSHGFFQDGGFSKTEKSVSSFSKITGPDDCVACHFLTHKISFSPEEFAYRIFPAEEGSQYETFYLCREFSSDLRYFYLRGPPVFFI